MAPTPNDSSQGVAAVASLELITKTNSPLLATFFQRRREKARNDRVSDARWFLRVPSLLPHCNLCHSVEGDHVILGLWTTDPLLPFLKATNCLPELSFERSLILSRLPIGSWGLANDTISRNARSRIACSRGNPEQASVPSLFQLTDVTSGVKNLWFLGPSSEESNRIRSPAPDGAHAPRLAVAVNTPRLTGLVCWPSCSVPRRSQARYPSSLKHSQTLQKTD
jgi:hypothetical protein